MDGLSIPGLERDGNKETHLTGAHWTAVLAELMSPRYEQRDPVSKNKAGHPRNDTQG